MDESTTFRENPRPDGSAGAAITWWTVALIWAAGIFGLSSLQPAGPPLFAFPGFDKVIHGILFGGLAAWVYRALTRGHGRPPAAAAAGAVALSTLYGITDELHQFMVPGRVADWRDGAANFAGATLVAVAAVYIDRRRHGNDSPTG